jgi:2-C-methyl-D-erythritol 4-phosphate cytidylyltransferase
MPEIVEIVVATEPESIEPMRELLARLAPQSSVRAVRGGAIRQQSVYEAVRAVSETCDAVLVHDGARPLVTSDDVRAGMREVRARRASLLAAPVVDTIKRVELQSRRVDATLDRATLWAAQTPQFAMRGDLLDAHVRAAGDAIEATDDAALLERAGLEVIVVHSTGENFKVTMPGDVERAAAILQARE